MKAIRQFIENTYIRIAKLDLSIRKKLLYGFLFIAIVPLLAIGVTTYMVASNAMMLKAKQNLQAIGRTKAAAIETFFDERRADMSVLHEIVFTMQQEAFAKLEAIRKNKTIWVEDYLLNRMGDASVLSRDPTTAKALLAFRKAGHIKTSAWNLVVKEYGPWLTHHKETYGYQNLYLVSANGRVLYSVVEGADLGQNLMRGALKDSPATKAFRKGFKKVAFQDFETYEPIGYQPASFVSAPIKFRGGVIGVLMGLLSVDQINTILQERTGLSKTTEAYLVGSSEKGITLRSERFTKDGAIGAPATDPYLDKALDGEAGTAFMTDDQGIYKLSAYGPIKVPGVSWAINVTAHVEEIISPKFAQTEEDFFTYYKEGYGYLNFYLINPEGYLFYSVIHEADYHTNLLGGPYQETNLGKAVQQVLNTQQLQFTDFEKYEPSQNLPTAFLAQPIVINNKIVLIVAAQLATTQIQVILEDYTGLGHTGDTYLVGNDRMWRSDSRFLDDLMVESTILNPEYAIDSEAINYATSEEADARIRTNYRNHKVLSTASIITIQKKSKESPAGLQWILFSDININEVRQPVMRMALISAAVLGTTLIGVVLLSLTMAGGLTVQVNRIMNLFSDIGMGQYQSRTEVVSQDELGSMAQSLNAMLDNTLNLIQSREEHDAMQAAVMKLLDEISALTEGDLTARAEVTEHITGAIADSFNVMAEQLASIIKGVKSATVQVGDTSKQVSTATETLAGVSEKQAEQVQKAIDVINNITASIRQVAENATKSATVSKNSMVSAKKGAKAVEKTNAAMTTIRERVQETARAIKRLGESSQEIGNIIQIITDIADRTSILALNASIQAAMAGEAGRGFAVVAEEVQRLAERSNSSTKQIEILVKNIQGDINEASRSMNESIQRVVTGSKLAKDAYAALQEIEKVSAQVAQMIHIISTTSEEQAAASESATKAMVSVGKISSQTSQASKKTAKSMQVLSKIAADLRVSVEAFKVEQEMKAEPILVPTDGESKDAFNFETSDGGSL
jgi:methyl-accepting chemotaxis protein